MIAAVAFRRCSPVATQAVLVNTYATARPATTDVPLLACRELTVTYGTSPETVVHALDGVSVAVYPGEAVALWGPSGSGKTTLLYALGGLVELTGGVVLWEGEPLSSLDTGARARARARGIAYVFQGAESASDVHRLRERRVRRMRGRAARGR